MVRDQNRLSLKSGAFETFRGQHLQSALTAESVETGGQAGRADIDGARHDCDGDRFGGIEDDVIDLKPFGGEIAYFLGDEDRRRAGGLQQPDLDGIRPRADRERNAGDENAERESAPSPSSGLWLG